MKLDKDNWLSKNIRPTVLLFLVLSTIILIFIDGVFAKFNVADNWINLLELVLITVIGAYFGGRSFEKLKNIDLDKKIKKEE